MACCLKLLAGQKELWARRSAEADAWQYLSITLAKAVARQLRLSCFIDQDEEEGTDELGGSSFGFVPSVRGQRGLQGPESRGPARSPDQVHRPYDWGRGPSRPG